MGVLPSNELVKSISRNGNSRRRIFADHAAAPLVNMEDHLQIRWE
jgi:hypothetical protein